MKGVSWKNPTITDFNPKTGSVGDNINVTGSQLLGTIDGLVGTFDARFNMRHTSVQDQQHITFRIPPGATSGHIGIKNNIGWSSASLNELYLI